MELSVSVNKHNSHILQKLLKIISFLAYLALKLKKTACISLLSTDLLETQQNHHKKWQFREVGFDSHFTNQFLLQIFSCSFFLKPCWLFKGATKFYFTHYWCVVIVLFNTSFCKSVFYADSFGKLFFYPSVLFLLCWILFKLHLHCTIIVYTVGIRVVCIFVLTYSLKEISCYKHLSTAFNNKKHASRELLSF